MKSKKPKAPCQAPEDTNMIINNSTLGDNCNPETLNAVTLTSSKGNKADKSKIPWQTVMENLTQKNIARSRSIFQGRDDVVAKYWKSKKNGKYGYSPICENKWNKEFCNLKKKVRGGCSKCKNAKYTPLSNQLIKEHIKGNVILGIYPLLQNNTCNFIAADFDKHQPTDPDPIDEVKKFVAVCEVQKTSCYLLRSKSGNGYHAYIFFSDAVPAWKARAVAFALLQEAGVIGYEVELTSFDRLFPNQSELSGKGLGNLISLPFQGKAGSKGHTVILDPETDFKSPYEDQWDVLSRIKKVSETALDNLIKKLNLKKEVQPERVRPRFEPTHGERQSAIFDRVKNACKFIKHCCDDSQNLPEPEWYALTTIAARCRDGRNLVHKHSENHPGYEYDATESKIDHALNDSGPYKCETILNNINPEYCSSCSLKGEIVSPINLGEMSIFDNFYQDIVKELNKNHAAIMVGGKFHILNEIIEPVFNRQDITLSTKADFLNLYSNQKVPDPKNPKKTTTKGFIWFDSEKRRQYQGIVFDPSETTPSEYYNLWEGFAYEPEQGNWDLFHKHIFETIAGGETPIFEWVLSWLARIVQDPGGKRPGTAIVLRGKQGTGKGIFVNTVGKLLGKHFIQIAQASQVTGRFNSHFKDALLVFVDEGVWAGDKQAEGTIKNLITEPFITVEQKFKDIIRVKNHVNLIFASNNDWVIPAGLEERRFFVLDIPDTRQQDHEYFKAIVNQMEDGGLEAMLHDLLELEIFGVDLRKFEQTAGLFEQKLHSMSTVQKYWYERLLDGSLISQNRFTLSIQDDPDDEVPESVPYNPNWDDGVVTNYQYDDYKKFAASLNDRYPLSQSQFGIALKKMCKKVKKIRRRSYGVRVAVRVFPTLDECRAEFAQLVKFDIDWELDEEE